jgi:DNA-binding NtrC family response regulator
LESELFGHEKGAFTGASGRRIGKFEEADGGTLLLDEISEMEPRLQAKLLRALQERVIDRVGGAKPVSVNIRVLATSNRSLSEEVAKGTFREDLFYRLNVVNLKVPPLRDRPQDILALAGYFVEKYSTLNQIAVLKLTADAKRLLLSARWKGNVRELENAIHRAVLLASGDEIGTDEIVIDQTSSFNAPMDQASRAAQTAESLTRSLVGKSVSEVEQHLILDTLDHCLGNRTHAAKILGISIRTLRNKLNEYVASGLALPDMQR